MYRELRSHIISLLNADTRLDGRKLIEYRKPIEIEYGIVKTAEGSARVRIGETDVIVGVNKYLIKEEPPVDRGIRESKAVDFKKLCITPGEKIWMIIIDICPINDAGNLFDASSLAALAALKDAKYPKFDGEKVDYKQKTDKKLPLEKTPIAVTVIKIGDKFIVDPDIEEEKVIDARLTVSSIEDGTLCAMQKGGDFPLTIEDIDKMLDIGIEKGKELRKYL